MLRHVALFLIVMSFSAAAQAVTCSIEPFEDAYEAADIVFSGTVVRVDYDEPRGAGDEKSLCGSKIITFKPDKIWKGDAHGDVPVFARDGCLYTGGYFTQGEQHLVYGRRTIPVHSDYDYESDGCRRTAPLDSERAKQDIAAIKKKSAKK